MVKNWQPSLTLGPTAFLLLLALFTLFLVDAVVLPYGAPVPQVIYQTVKEPIRRPPISPVTQKIDPFLMAVLAQGKGVPVVITLNPPSLTLFPAEYRKRIKDDQDKVLAQLSKTDFTLRERSSAPPALIGDITLTGTLKAAQLPQVLKISPEKPLSQATPSSLPLPVRPTPPLYP